MSKFILALDKLGGSFSFKQNGKERYRTYLGGFLTILSVLVFTIFFFLTGIDFYLRINPNVTMSKTLGKEYFNYTLNDSNFLFAFRIESKGEILERPDLFHIEPHYIVFNQTERGMKKIVDEIIPFHRCKYEDANYNEIYNTSVMSQFLCLDKPKNSEGHVLGGLYDAKYIRYFKIQIKHCLSSKDNEKNNITCSKNNTEFTKLFAGTSLYVKYIVQSYYVDSNEYYYPFRLSFDSLYQTMELNTQKKIYFYFKKGIFNDNKGWILDETNLRSLIGLDREKLDFKDGIKDYTKNTFYEINLYFDRIIENYNRRYQKIQDVLAGVGGLIKIITFIFGNITLYYNQYFQYLDLINEVLIYNKNKYQPTSLKKTDLNIIKKSKNLIPINLNSYKSNSLIESSNKIINENEDISKNILQEICENKETVFYKKKSLNPENRIKKVRNISVFRKNDDKTNNNNQNLNINSVNINNNEKQDLDDNNNTKPIKIINLSIWNYIYQYLCIKEYKRNENFYNFLNYSILTDKYLDIKNILEFFIKYEPILDQLVMSADLSFSNNNLLLNNS